MEDQFGAKTPPIDDSAARARAALDEAKGAIGQTAREAATTVKDSLRDTSHALKDKAMGVMGDAQAKAADQSRTAANTLRSTANNLDGELPWMKTALNKTADGFEHLTSALNKGDVNQVMSAVGDFARRQPALFMGLSVAAGFALARVGKTALESSGDSPSTPADPTIQEAVAPYAPSAEI
jgi:hypothetical protein